MMEESKPTILVGMSGGLDSTYAAYRYREQGYQVIGAVLRMSEETDIASAQTAAEQVGIPLEIIDARADFDRYVKQYFADAYAMAQTPNPCVECNRYVKVAMLCERARELGIPRVSTGHYARVLRDDETGRYFVRAAEDRRKDQSYVLWQLPQWMLAMLELPMAELEKTEVRSHAAALGFTAAAAKESQDICFLPNGGYIPFVEQRLGKTFAPGDFVDETGRVVGRHEGIIRYTVGQRKGLGIALGHPMFVTKIDAASNVVHLAPAGMEFGGSVVVDSLNFQRLAPEALAVGMAVTVKIRYAAPPAHAVIDRIDDGRITVRFDVPQRAVTPGQSAVFYDTDGRGDVLFGGKIVG
ncbi:MAG: tRNA 2-thiouridine(34) synthase MnmA [Clostridia bacterium]|nr:tRNA 2-thiouridine(34) synthase MnmA [Clostridia bacterium]